MHEVCHFLITQNQLLIAGKGIDSSGIHTGTRDKFPESAARDGVLLPPANGLLRLPHDTSTAG